MLDLGRLREEHQPWDMQPFTGRTDLRCAAAECSGDGTCSPWPCTISLLLDQVAAYEGLLAQKNQQLQQLERKLREAEAMFAAAEAHNIVFIREDVPPSLADPLGSWTYRVYHR